MDINTPEISAFPKVKDKLTEEAEAAPASAWRPRLVTIEPVLFLWLFSGGLAWPAISGLLYRKVCLENYDKYTCDNLHNSSFHDQEDHVQKVTSHWQLVQNYVFEIPAILMAFTYGSLSDHVSRKLTIILPAVGQILSTIIFGLTAIFMDAPVLYTVLGGLPNAFTGGWITLFMASFSYLSESCSPETRTKRVYIAEGVAGVSLAISFSVSGVILDNTSYTFVFSLAVGISILCSIYVLVFLREPPKKKSTEEFGKGRCSLFLMRTKESMTVVFRKREENGRTRLLVSLLIVFTSMVSSNALGTIGFLFLKRRPLSWTQSTYGIYMSVDRIIPSLFLLLVMPFLKTKLKLRDTTLMLIGLFSTSLSELWFSFCVKTWMVFLTPVFGSLRGAGTVLRSTVSQLVHPHELGMMFATLGALQSLSGMVGTTLYNTIYPHTFGFWPGFCFTLGTAIAVIPLTLIIWLHRDMAKSQPFYKLSETEMDNIEVVKTSDRAPLLVVDEDDEEFEINDDDVAQKESVIA